MPATVAQSQSQPGRPGLGVSSALHGMAWSAGRPRACAERDCNQQVDGPRLTVASSQTPMSMCLCVCVSAHNKRCELQEFMGQLGVSGDKQAK